MKISTHTNSQHSKRRSFTNVRVNSLWIVIAIMANGFALTAQPLYKISNSKDIDMKLLGTSTLHKWAMDAKTFDGQAEFAFLPGNSGKLTGIKSLTFSLEVANLKSDEKALDRNAYKALKADEYKDIYYKLLSATLLSEKDGAYHVKTHGNLTIAGVTREVAIDADCHINNDTSVAFAGSYKLKMTDYEVQPPTFMLGAMKTGDEITLDFKLIYQK